MLRVCCFVGAVLTAHLLLSGVGCSASEPGAFSSELRDDRLVITRGAEPVAHYLFRDPQVRRPFFAHVHAPGGIQVTRNFPPVPGQDAVDHDTMHPGVWLGFGDLNGHDFWRNRATIRHLRFSEPPLARAEQLTFATENRLETLAGEAIGLLTSRIGIMARPGGHLLIWEAEFSSTTGDLVFGDQEEMGLGVRLATPLTEKNGGTIRSRAGARGARATWGKTAEWCDYSGVRDGRRVGMTVMPSPRNFRPSWFHNRDYGLMAANPFGRQAFTRGEPSAVVVKPGETFRLRFGVWLHASAPDDEPDCEVAYQDFLQR